MIENSSTPTSGRWYRIMGSPATIDGGLLLLRLWLGSMMIYHGYGKVFGDNAKFVSGVADMGFPAPEVFAWLAAWSEFGGGILLALGLATRFSTIMAAITMAVAAFVRHGPDPFGKKELAITYLVLCSVLVLMGAGRFSLDWLISRRSSSR